jgi:collagen type VI alpha
VLGTEEVCEEAGIADYFMIIDGSTSIGDANFEKLKRWLGDVVETFPDQARYGCIEFSGNPVLLWNLDKFNTKKAAKGIRPHLSTFPQRRLVTDAFLHMPYIMGTTRTASALNKLIADSLNVGNRPEFPDVCLVVTDGFSSDDPAPPATNLRLHVGYSSYKHIEHVPYLRM